MRAADGFKYFLTDHLGSVSVVLSDTGAVLEQQRYLPFGGVRTDIATPPYRITSTDFTYTSQRNLPGTGLMDYKARFCSPTLGRFIQPDTIIPSTDNPQSWNRYSYVMNRPVNIVDPTGHRPDDGCRTGEGCSVSQKTIDDDLKKINEFHHTTERNKCKAGEKLHCSYAENHPFETAAFTITGLVAGPLVYEFAIGGGAVALVESSFFLPMVGNALYGGIVSSITYVGMNMITGEPFSTGGIVGAFVSGAISGAAGSLSTPLAGSLLKPLGISRTAGSSLISGGGSLAAYYIGGNTSNAVNVQLGNKPSFQPSLTGPVTSFGFSAALSPVASSNFPVKSINSLNQASHFIPGRTTNTWLIPNNLHQQNIFAIIGGSLLGDAFGGSQ